MKPNRFPGVASRRRGLGLAGMAAALALAACGALKPAPDRAVLAESWFSPPAAYPGVCMRLMSNGELRFAGGFAFFNPGRWRYDAGTAQLSVELGGAAPLPPALADPANSTAAPNSASLLRVDPARRAVLYTVRPDTEAIGLGGLVFYRTLPCPP
ncbi:MAG: hypothetical protein V4754_10750 [Pseudomonadota bacterium]